MSKKLLIFAILIFIITIGGVSAQDINNETVVSESQNLNDLSTISVDSETADILQEADHARFNVDNSTPNWQISVLDDNDEYVCEGTVTVSLEKSGDLMYYDLSYGNISEFPLLNYNGLLPDNVILTYSGDNYNVDNMTIFAEQYDTIKARDVVDENSFSATFLDWNNDPICGEEVSITITNDDYYDSVIYITDSNGVVTVHPSLKVGNYTVFVDNRYTGQFNNYWWNITDKMDIKSVEIWTVQDGSNLIMGAADAFANNVSEGIFKVTSEKGEEFSAYVWGEYVSFNLYEWDIDNFPENMYIEYTSDYYNPANSTCCVDEINNTIVASDVAGESSFSATFYYENGNPVKDELMLFQISDGASFSMYAESYTDEMGIATIEPALPIGNYTVNVVNRCTDQSRKYWFNISQIDDSRFADINIDQVGGSLIMRAFDVNGNNINEGYFLINHEQYTLRGNFVKFNLYNYKEYLLQNLTIEFKNINYYPANASFYVDALFDTINASDVVDEFSFSAYFTDEFGTPLTGKEVSLLIHNDDYYEYVSPITDSSGRAVINKTLPIGNYKVQVFNPEVYQYNYYWWNITKEYESKNALINVTQDNYKFTINVFDNEGNIINDGSIIIKDGYLSDMVEINNGTAEYLFLDRYYDGPRDVNLIFIFDNGNYYSANTTCNFTYIDSINAYNTESTVFDATFWDMNGYPLNNQEVLFSIYDYNTKEFIENITKKTDAYGLASIEKSGEHYHYEVLVTNLVTHQYDTLYWINKEQFEVVPIAYYDDQSECYKIDNETLKFKVSEGATGMMYIYEGSRSWHLNITKGENTIALAHSGLNSIWINYYGDENYYEEYSSFSVFVNEMIAPTFTLLENFDVDYGQKFDFKVNLKHDSDVISNASVEIKIGNDTYNLKTDKNGDILIPLALDAGVYDVFVKYAGGDYLPVNKTATFTVNKIYIDLVAFPVLINEGDDAVINVLFSKNVSGKVIATVNGKNYSGDIKDSEANIIIPGLTEGNYIIPVTFFGNNYYDADATAVVTVNPQPVLPKENLTLKAVADPITIGEDAVIVVSGFENATGNVTAKVGNGVYTAPIVDGTATFKISGLIENATASITYAGDDKYNNASTAVDIVVNPKQNATMNIDVPPVTEGQNTTINVELPEDATGTVTAVVDGKNYTAPLEDGKTTITIPDLVTGNYTVPVTYSGDSKYNPSAKEVNFTVEEDKSDIIKADDLNKYYRGPERFVVNVTDYQGNPLENKTVTININGVPYNRTTNSKGQASMAINLNSGEYQIVVSYNGKSVNATITILPTVNGTDIVKIFRNGTQYYATFRDSEGNYLAQGTEVTFNINGVMYTRKVTENGLAKLNINLEQGEYIITAINNVTGEMSSNKITVISRIIENNDVTKYYRNATQYTVKLIGDDGNPVGAGVTVRFNINGVLYERKTNESGIAKLNLNLQPGDYVITAEYEGCKVSNNIKILPVLSAEDIDMKYRDGTKFVATLVDGQGKAYAGQNVTFNINGVFYNRLTDGNGQAKLNINLMAGEYIITSSYNGSNIANKITIRS